MTSFSAGVDAALAGQSVLPFFAVEILLPGNTIRLLDGPGTVTFSSKTFVGRHSTFGALGPISDIADGVSEEAPRITITVLPPSNAAAATLAAANAQGASVSVWFGTLNPATGLVSDAPELRFIGEVDVPNLRVGQGARSVEFEVSSVWEKLFDDDEGARLSDAFHQWVRPGELGFQYHAETQRQLPWGADVPRPTVVVDVPRQAGGGAGGGGFGADEIRNLFPF